MPVPLMLEVIMNALVGADSLQKLQVRLAILQARFNNGVLALELNPIVIVRHAMLLENLADDVRYRQLLKHPAAAALPQAAKPGAKAQTIACRNPRISLSNTLYLPVDTALVTEAQISRPIHQPGAVKPNIVIQDIQFKGKGFADRFTAEKGQDDQGTGQPCDIQPKKRLVKRIKHQRFSLGATRDSR